LGLKEIGNNLSIVVVDREGKESAEASMNDWESFNYGDGGDLGWVRRWTLSIPTSMKEPAAVYITKHGPDTPAPDHKNTDPLAALDPTDEFKGNDYIRFIKIAT
jgi:hypothetical protein